MLRSESLDLTELENNLNSVYYVLEKLIDIQTKTELSSFDFTEVSKSIASSLKHYATYLKAAYKKLIEPLTQLNEMIIIFPDIEQEFLRNLEEKRINWRYTSFLHKSLKKYIFSVIDFALVHLNSSSITKKQMLEKIKSKLIFAVILWLILEKY